MCDWTLRSSHSSPNFGSVYITDTQKTHKEVFKNQTYCYIIIYLGLPIGLWIFFLGKCWKVWKTLCQHKALLFLLLPEIRQSICTCQGQGVFVPSGNSCRCCRCCFSDCTSEVGLVSSLWQHVMSKKLWKKWNSFSLPDVAVLQH